jgi:hypothetical protein
LSTSNNGIDGSVLVDFSNVKVAPSISPQFWFLSTGALDLVDQAGGRSADRQ